MASFMSLVFCLTLSEAKRLVGQIGLWPEMHPHEVSYNPQLPNQPRRKIGLPSKRYPTDRPSRYRFGMPMARETTRYSFTPRKMSRAQTTNPDTLCRSLGAEHKVHRTSSETFDPIFFFLPTNI